MTFEKWSLRHHYFEKEIFEKWWYLGKLGEWEECRKAIGRWFLKNRKKIFITQKLENLIVLDRKLENFIVLKISLNEVYKPFREWKSDYYKYACGIKKSNKNWVGCRENRAPVYCWRNIKCYRQFGRESVNSSSD